jgi:hypothetical protein
MRRACRGDRLRAARARLRREAGNQNQRVSGNRGWRDGSACDASIQGLRRKVLEHDPDRGARRVRHGRDIGLGQSASESLDDDVRQVERLRDVRGEPPHANAVRRLVVAVLREPGTNRARLATSSIQSVTAMPCSRVSWRASRQHTPASPKLSTMRQNTSQRSEGGMGLRPVSGASLGFLLVVPHYRNSTRIERD